MSCNRIRVDLRRGMSWFQPVGFSNELQRAESPPGPVNDSVSIPIGFSNELQPQNLPDVSRLALFQSLSGFPMSCNLGLALVPQPGDLFQSLSGFPMSCNGGTVYRAADGRGVSIPIGFSNELQHGPCTCVVLNCLGFQSLSGFPMSCNSPNRRQRERHHVSIPIGFSNERNGAGRAWSPVRFNPIVLMSCNTV